MSEPFDRIADHAKICEGLHELYVRKNHDYGNSFSKIFADYGMTSSVIRLEDKMHRLQVLANVKIKDIKVPDETIKDTLRDLANYAIMTLVELDAKG